MSSIIMNIKLIRFHDDILGDEYFVCWDSDLVPVRIAEVWDNVIGFRDSG